MKILYDHQMYSLQKYGGITKYFCELIKNLPPGNDYDLSVLYSNNQHLRDDHNFFKKIYVPISQKRSRINDHLRVKSYKINNYFSQYKIKKGQFDLFHPTYFNPYFLRIIKKPYIVTVHDLIVFKFEVNKKKDKMEHMKRIVNNAAHIIAISQHTKKDLVDILAVKPEKIDVVYHGYHSPNADTRSNEYGRYLLYVGARAGYKNFANFARAFSHLSKHDKDLKLICAGDNFTRDEIDLLRQLNIAGRTTSMGVDESGLSQLYQHALTFVYPTKYEGFGMSILEAFANNCPVCLSNASCLPEIAGDAGSFFNPDDPDSMVEAIGNVIYNSENAAIKVQQGADRLKFFSWEKCALETIESYKKALR